MFKRYFPLLIISIGAIILILFPHISASAAQQGLSLCAEAIIPSLFPFLILMSLWRSLGYSAQLSQKTEPITSKLFHLPGNTSSALLVGCIGGFPAGAKITSELYKQGDISKKYAEHLLLFCSNAGPAFIFGIIGHRLFNSSIVALFLWAIHLLGALIIGILFRPEAYGAHQLPRKNIPHSSTLSSSFVAAIQSAGNDTIQICMFIVSFSILTGYLQHLLPTGSKNSLLYALFLCTLDITGVPALLKKVPSDVAFIAASVLLAWNGLCVHCQILSIAAESGLSLKKYFSGKLLHMMLSLALSCALINFIPFQHMKRYTFPLSIFYAFPLLILLVSFAALKTSYRNKTLFRI